MENLKSIIILLTALSGISHANTDWSSNATLPGNEKCFSSYGHQVCLSDGNRKNVFGLSSSELKKYIYNGSKHALNYPVEVTELKIPKNAMDKFFEADSNSPIRRFIFKITKSVSPFKNFQDMFDWVGLHNFPKTTREVGPNIIADMGSLEQYPMGVSIFHNGENQSMTFSCAACHSNNLFGTKVLGMTNRFPRSNEFFLMGKKALKLATPALFKIFVGPSKKDMEHFKKARNAIKYVELKKPLTLGLDTSLAQVGLSLAIRNKDDYATRPRRIKKNNHPLKTKPADSKPAVWWNLKYKTKWLSDASIDSGNPIFTNFLWNEIGRGIDLKKLESWLKNNKNKVDELTSYVFNTEAPRFDNYFPNSINIEKAKRGEKLYLQNCKGCHGIYEKGWSDNASSYAEKIQTTKVWYHTKTIAVDIGTDPYRYEGMKYFANDLNRLKISKEMGTVVTPSKGYVPPPLIGIWARWPYLHNNSIPTLYDVLSSEQNRPVTYIATPSEDKRLDYDLEKNGYPSPEYIKEPYKSDSKYFFDTRVKGLSNMGHSKMMTLEDGKEKFSHEQKLELIEFLKSL